MTKIKFDTARNKQARDRLGKILYGAFGCAACGINPTASKLGRRLLISNSTMHDFLSGEDISDSTLVKLEMWLDRVE